MIRYHVMCILYAKKGDNMRQLLYCACMVIGVHAAFQLPDLDYESGALEPHIPKKIMQLHHDKHHKGYVDGLNDTVSQPGFQEYKRWDMSRLLLYVDTLPETIRDDVRFFGGGHANHAFFWRIMRDPKSTKAQPDKDSELVKAINRDFGSFEVFQKTFTHVASGVRGSGWAWLVIDGNGKLKVRSTYNHDTPLSQGEVPILVLDVWEHAYYLKYTNKRGDYIANWWDVVHWDFVERLYTAFAVEKTPITQWFEHVQNMPYVYGDKQAKQNTSKQKKMLKKEMKTTAV